MTLCQFLDSDLKRLAPSTSCFVNMDLWNQIPCCEEAQVAPQRHMERNGDRWSIAPADSQHFVADGKVDAPAAVKYGLLETQGTRMASLQSPAQNTDL